MDVHFDLIRFLQSSKILIEAFDGFLRDSAIVHSTLLGGQWGLTF
jgi:hypothetical protein